MISIISKALQLLYFRCDVIPSFKRKIMFYELSFHSLCYGSQHLHRL